MLGLKGGLIKRHGQRANGNEHGDTGGFGLCFRGPHR